jgi:DNA-binding response OmpR family regulator
MSCKDILIIEDDKDIRESFTFILEEEGYKVVQAENGQIALNLLRLRTNPVPGCIILDLMMPVMDGKTFLETLSKNHPHDLCKIPIILATAMGSSDDEMSDLPCMVEKFSKPLDMSELISTVRKHCGVVN